MVMGSFLLLSFAVSERDKTFTARQSSNNPIGRERVKARRRFARNRQRSGGGATAAELQSRDSVTVSSPPKYAPATSYWIGVVLLGSSVSQDTVLETVAAIRGTGRPATVELLADVLKAKPSEVEAQLEALTKRRKVYKLVGGAEWPSSPDPATTYIWYLPRGC